MMLEHHWQECRVGPLIIWESVWNLNGGSYGIYFEARLNSTLEKYFEACLNDREKSGSFHSCSGL
jgi:hypothetical protein